MPRNTRFAATAVTLVAVAVAAVVGDELFSFEKLSQYTSLATCFAKIHADFATCNAKAEEKGKAYLEGIDPDSEWARRVKCCGTWKLRDCWVRAAQKKCSKEQSEHVYRLPYTFMPKLEVLCRSYPPDSGKCSFPVAMVATLAVVLVLLVVAGVGGALYWRRRRREARAAPLKNSFPAETEKMKATPA